MQTSVTRHFRWGATSGRLALGVAFCFGASMLAMQSASAAAPPATISYSTSASAINPPPTITFDAGQFLGVNLGQWNIFGAVDELNFAQSGTGSKKSLGLLGTDKPVGTEFNVVETTLQKTTGFLQAEVELLAPDFWELGAPPPKPFFQVYSTGPCYVCTVTLAPSTTILGTTVSLTAGFISSLEGYEYTQDINNANVFASSIFIVENGSSKGAALNWSHGPFSGVIEFGDGWDTGVFNFFQGLASYTAPKTISLYGIPLMSAGDYISVFTADNISNTGLNTKTLGFSTLAATVPHDQSFTSAVPALINSTMVGAYSGHQFGNLNLTPEVQYVWSDPNPSHGIPKFTSNLGVALFADYKFPNTPYSIGGYFNYFRSNGPSFWFLNPGSEGEGLSITPTWQSDFLFARVDVGFLHLSKIGTGTNGIGRGVGFNASGTEHNIVQSALELGAEF